MKKGQASIEVITIAVLIIALSTVVVSKAFSVQNDVLAEGILRQETITALGKLDTPYALHKTLAIDCGNEIKGIVFIVPNPQEPDLTTITAEIQTGVETALPPNLLTLQINVIEELTC